MLTKFLCEFNINGCNKVSSDLIILIHDTKVFAGKFNPQNLSNMNIYYTITKHESF